MTKKKELLTSRNTTFSGDKNKKKTLQLTQVWEIATNSTFIVPLFMFTLTTFTLTFNEG